MNGLYFCRAVKLDRFSCTMTAKSPSGKSTEFPVEVHTRYRERKSNKRPKRSADKDGIEVIIDSRHDDMSSAQRIKTIQSTSCLLLGFVTVTMAAINGSIKEHLLNAISWVPLSSFLKQRCEMDRFYSIASNEIFTQCLLRRCGHVCPEKRMFGMLSMKVAQELM